MDDKHFDDIINEALNNFEANDQPADWDVFAPMLEQEQADSDWDEFDQSIVEKLKDYSVTVPAGAWSAFRPELEKSLYETYAEELDRSVKSSLGNLQVPYDHTTWPILEQKLEERKAYIRKLILTKSIEAAIVIFAIFTFYTYFPYYHQQYKNWKQDQLPVVVEEPSEPTSPSKIKELAVHPKIMSPASLKKIDHSTESLQSSGSELLAANNRASEFLTTDSEIPSVANLESDRTENTGTNNSTIKSIEPTSEKLINTRPPNVVAAIDQDKISDALPYKEKSIVEKNRKVPAQVDEFGSRATLNLGDFKALNNSNIHLASNHQMVPAFNNLNERKQKPKWSLGIYGAADMNFVNIPQDNYEDFNKSSFVFLEKDLTEFGFGTGLNVQVRLGDLALETGINYSSKTYDPNKEYKPVDGYRELDYKKISLEVIEIPVQMQYYWNQIGRLQLYATGGAAINAIVASYHDLIIPQPRRFGQPQNVAQERNEEFEFTRIKTAFLEDGIDTELYLTLNLGMGLEYQLSKEYALFLEPMYKQQFLKKGVGPNKDRINTASLKVGSRMTF